MEASQPRTHTFSWHDHRLAQAAARGLGGLEYLQAMLAGTIPPPPFVALLGLELREVAPERVVFTLRPQEFMHNSIGLVHGGVTASLFDTAVGCACITVVPDGKVAVTLDLAVRYFKPLTMRSGMVRCVGSVLNRGRTTMTAQGELFDESGRLCGHATSTLALVDAAARVDTGK